MIPPYDLCFDLIMFAMVFFCIFYSEYLIDTSRLTRYILSLVFKLEFVKFCS